ncbi:MAG: VOC family protein [Actinomycetota bacterium]|jgi:hypothetical protein
MIELLGLRTVIYPTEDLLASKQWWQEFLGLAPYFDEEFYVGFSIDGYELGLLPNGEVGDGAYTYWGVTDVMAAVDAAIEQGCAIHADVADVGAGIITALVMLPDESIVGFIYNPHFDGNDDQSTLN